MKKEIVHSKIIKEKLDSFTMNSQVKREIWGESVEDIFQTFCVFV